jgi:hypothetical protein
MNQKYPEETFGFSSEIPSREVAMEWWSKIPTIEREQLWITQNIVKTYSRFAKNATGGEIEKIYLALQK